MIKENPPFESEKRNEMIREIVNDILYARPCSAKLIRLTDIVASEAVQAIRERIEKEVGLAPKLD